MDRNRSEKEMGEEIVGELSGEGAVEVELWRVPTPIPRPVLTAAGPYDTYFHLVVIARRGDHVGWGYSGMATAQLLDDAWAFATTVRESRSLPLDALLRVERAGIDTASRGATN